MKIKNAFQIFFQNYSLVLKVALTQLVVFALFVGLGALILNDTVIDVSAGFAQTGIIDKLNALVAEVLSGEFSAERFTALLAELQSSFSAWATADVLLYEKLALSGVVLLLLSVAVTYLLNFYAVPFNQSLNDFMSTSAKTPFFWRFFKSLGISAKTQLIYIAVPFLLDIFILFGIIGLYSTILSLMGLFGLVLAVVLLLFCYSLRKTLFAFWIPSLVINQMPPRASLHEGVKMIADGFGRVLWRILCTVFAVFALIIVILFAAVNIFTVAIVLFLLLNCELFISTVCMVEFYRQSNFGFYIAKMRMVEAKTDAKPNEPVDEEDPDEVFKKG